MIGFQEIPALNDFFYPELFIAINQHNIPTYLEKVGLKEVLVSYGFDCEQGHIPQLIKFCREAHPDALRIKYSPNKKKPSPLSSLIEDKLIGGAIRKSLDFCINKVLEICEQQQIPIYKHIERKIYLPEIKIQDHKIALQPALRFEKTALGINYSLRLVFDDKELIPSQLSGSIFTQLPNRILLGYNLFEVAEIDAVKLKPFLAKEKVFIPDRLAYQYFSSFVSDLMNRVDVEINGLEFTDLAIELKPVLSFGESWMGKDFEGILHFYYDEVKFLPSEKLKARSKIIISPDNSIAVYRVKRNFEREDAVIRNLELVGAQALPNGRFGFEASDRPFSFLHYIIANKEKLVSLGIEIKSPVIDGKKVCLDSYAMNLTAIQQKDWFDISAVIVVGNLEISFKDLIHQIKKNDPVFILPNGEVFIIPAEWMERYDMLSRFSEAQGDGLRLAKSNFAILDNLDLLDEKSLLKAGDQETRFEDITISKALQAQLRPYQMEGAKWLIAHYENGLGACLADDMGLGKTVQTLAVLLHAKDKMKTAPVYEAPRQLSLFEEYTEQRSALCALIVLPSSLIFNWENEIKKFAPSLMITKHLGNDRVKKASGLQHYDIVLTTYQTMVRDFDLLASIEFSYIVLDESHYIKNRDSKVFQQVTKLKTQNRISLSGTPIENSLADLWSQMQFINPDILGNYGFFKKHYRDPIEKDRDEQAIEELRQLLQPFILRRTKEEVLDDLPELNEQIFYSEMSEEQKKWSEREKSKARNELLFSEEAGEGANKLRVINALMRLRQLANHPLLVDKDSDIKSGKFEDVTNTLEALVASGHKTIVFSSFVKHLEIYEDWLNERKIDYCKLTGEDSTSARKTAVDSFMNDKSKLVFLMSIKAGGVGLNLTEASYVIILDPWWNPFVERQAIARAHRIGQQNKVSVLRFISKDSIEEKILKLQETKMKLAGDFIDLGEMPSFSKTELSEMLY